MKFVNFSFKHLLAALIGLLCLVQSVSADTLDEIRQRKKIIVAIDLGSPPFGMTDDKLQPYGSDVSAARMLAKDLGVALEIVQVTGPNRVPFLLTHKADIVIASFSITPERAKVIAFSVPYSASESVVASESKLQIKSLDDLVGKRVGVVRGNLQDTLLTPIVPKGTILVRYDDDSTNTVALLSGQVDAIGTARELVTTTARKNPGRSIETKFAVKVVPHGIGVRKEDTALLGWINNWVVTNMKNGNLAKSYEAAAGAPLADLSQYMPK
ncbi:transporter substrate-binding domain-containing protein [Herbaspirillum sp. WKF16]|uniref:transporter substrate-binding domain-containing protein n=1 Tax=Herbaspirillum sp. WKF16 TaxID=3028312 RepID=UPI0023A999DA|nr:transporter substrate-binding domain-containing protein [Herbaspirillum sp. WKF16]WDZ96917.1 transporter substrate-binding domain-containing protein [Herbaspirillum sp. WKF16]